jgi:hypothetical protein
LQRRVDDGEVRERREDREEKRDGVMFRDVDKENITRLISGVIMKNIETVKAGIEAQDTKNIKG